MEEYFWSGLILTNFMTMIVGLIVRDYRLALLGGLMLVYCMIELGKRTGLL